MSGRMQVAGEKQWCRAGMAVTLSSVMLLEGCVAVYRPPQVDLEAFMPLPVEQRLMKQVRLRWLVREDASEYCARITGLPVTPVSRPMACAYWNVPRRECTVITPKLTGYNYVGHELRHCFEGNFHG